MAQARVDGGTPDPFDASDHPPVDDAESASPALLKLLGGAVSDRVDDQAFAEFYRHFKPKLVGYASRLRADDPEGAADLALYDTHLALTRGSFKAAPALRAYLYRAVKSRVAGEHRKPIPIPVVMDDWERPGLAVEDQSQVIVDRDVLEGLLDSLSEAQREVLRARYLDDQTAEAVSSATGRGPDAVYQLQRRGLERLRRALPSLFLLVLMVVGVVIAVTRVRESAPVENLPVDQPDLVDENGQDTVPSIDAEGRDLTVELDATVEESAERVDPDGRVSEPPDDQGGDDRVDEVAVEPPTVSTTVTTVTTVEIAPTSSTVGETTSVTDSTLVPTTEGLPLNVRGQVAQVKFQHSGLCLTVLGSVDGGAFTQETCRTDGQEQRFEWVSRGNGYAIRAVHSMLCLGAENGSLAEGARIVQQSCTGGDEQSLASPDATLTFANTELCVGVLDESMEPGAQLVQSDCGPSPHQQLEGA